MREIFFFEVSLRLRVLKCVKYFFLKLVCGYGLKTREIFFWSQFAVTRLKTREKNVFIYRDQSIYGSSEIGRFRPQGKCPMLFFINPDL